MGNISAMFLPTQKQFFAIGDKWNFLDCGNILFLFNFHWPVSWYPLRILTQNIHHHHRQMGSFRFPHYFYI